MLGPKKSVSSRDPLSCFPHPSCWGQAVEEDACRILKHVLGFNSYCPNSHSLHLIPSFLFLFYLLQHSVMRKSCMCFCCFVAMVTCGCLQIANSRNTQFELELKQLLPWRRVRHLMQPQTPKAVTVLAAILPHTNLLISKLQILFHKSFTFKYMADIKVCS